MIEALPTGDGAFVAYCRCTWWNGPFLSAAKAVEWGERTHRDCDQGVLMTTSSGPQQPGENPPSATSHGGPRDE